MSSGPVSPTDGGKIQKDKNQSSPSKSKYRGREIEIRTESTSSSRSDSISSQSRTSSSDLSSWDITPKSSSGSPSPSSSLEQFRPETDESIVAQIKTHFANLGGVGGPEKYYASLVALKEIISQHIDEGDWELYFNRETLAQLAPKFQGGPEITKTFLQAALNSSPEIEWNDTLLFEKSQELLFLLETRDAWTEKFSKGDFAVNDDSIAAFQLVSKFDDWEKPMTAEALLHAGDLFAKHAIEDERCIMIAHKLLEKAIEKGRQQEPSTNWEEQEKREKQLEDANKKKEWLADLYGERFEEQMQSIEFTVEVNFKMAQQGDAGAFDDLVERFNEGGKDAEEARSAIIKLAKSPKTESSIKEKAIAFLIDLAKEGSPKAYNAVVSAALEGNLAAEKAIRDFAKSPSNFQKYAQELVEEWGKSGK